MAFYDPTLTGTIAARAYLMTLGQFSDITAQEMYREPGADLDLDGVLSNGRMEMGPGRYETLVYAGELDERPVLTFTAPWSMGDIQTTKPVARYLTYLASGLIESHGWSPRQIAEYLADCPGAKEYWSAEAIEKLIEP